MPDTIEVLGDQKSLPFDLRSAGNCSAQRHKQCLKTECYINMNWVYSTSDHISLINCLTTSAVRYQPLHRQTELDNV